MILERPYSKELFDEFLKDFLPDFAKDERQVRTPDKSILREVTQLGTSNETNLTVLEAECDEADSKKRIAITQAAFRVLRDHGIRNALIAFHDGADQWRLSLLTSTLDLKDGKVIKKYSNPRRYSYLLGIGAKTRTPHKYLIEKGSVLDIKSLQERFSVEVVNRQFYEAIADLFTKLVGGERGRTRYPGLLKINSQPNQNNEHQEFAVRLIGRIIFCWFLKEKKSASGVPIVPGEMLSLSAVASHSDYYHAMLEPLFFELLNKRVSNRHEALRKTPFATVPYLNGGLFSPQSDDFYQQNPFTGGGNPGIVSIPDSWFNELFTILEEYNFTVDENTSYDVDLSIDPEMLGRIFENLLAEINPETGESARKSTGSFYTPREVVDYMVDSSLLEYLKSKTCIDDEKLKAVISWGQEDDAEHPLSKDEKKIIVDALSTLKILDPACGSGAFPIGILQKVVYILQQVDDKAEIWLENQLKYVNSPELRRDIEEKYRSENYDWLRKLGVIRESIFGVDIQTIATEIAKLRCFLTMVIEEEVEDEKENRGIRPLPNLDFKFVTANSLVGLPGSGGAKSQPTGTLNMFDDESHIERLKEIRNQYFGADAEERSHLRDEFKDLQLSMVRRARDSMGATSDLYNILSDWNPFTHDKTGWFDPEWMFGIGKFDIIIANPPYLGNKGHKDEFQIVQASTLGKYYQRRMDLFYFFFHLALDISEENACIAFITTNYYPTATGANKLRADFKRRSVIKKLVNFNELKIFESALGQHNMITILNKRQGEEEVADTCITARKGNPSSDLLHSIMENDDAETIYNKIPQRELYDGDEHYIRIMGISETSNNPIQTVLNKIKNQGETLNTICNVNQGIVTGANKVSNRHITKFGLKSNVGDGIFVLNKAELRDKGISPDSEHIKDWFKNSDIKKYWCNTSPKEYVLYFKDRKIKQPIEEAVKKHFSNYEELLIERLSVCKNNKFQWNIVSKWLDRGEYYLLFYPRKQEIFESHKIVVSQRCIRNNFGYNETPWYAASDVFFITEKDDSISLKYTLSLINSKLYYIWLYHRGKRKGEILELTAKPLSEIPIKMISKPEQAPFIEIVDRILAITGTDNYANNPASKSAVKEYEKQIDKLVYKLFGLTPEEIESIEEAIPSFEQ